MWLDREDGCVVASLADQPVLFVQEAFPWGSGTWGSGTLHDHIRPDEGQMDIPSAVRDGLSGDKALQIAIASGHANWSISSTK